MFSATVLAFLSSQNSCNPATSSIFSLGTAAGFNPNAEIVSTKIYSVSSENLSIKSNAVSLNTVDLSNSSNQSVLTFEPSNFTNLLFL